MEFVMVQITVHVKLDGKVPIVTFVLPYLDANMELAPIFLNAIVMRNGMVLIVTYVSSEYIHIIFHSAKYILEKNF